jgi:hypothetical protein
MYIHVYMKTDMYIYTYMKLDSKKLSMFMKLNMHMN